MSRYLSILATQRPFDLGIDPKDSRIVFSSNYECVAAAPVSAFEEEIAKVINSASAGTLGTDMWIGRAANVPTSGNGPFVFIINSGGSYPYETHNNNLYERLAVQIIVRSATYSATRTRAMAIWRALHGKHNVTITA